MRNSNEILAELNAKNEVLQSAAANEREALAAEVRNLMNEFNAASLDEEVRKANAQKRVLSEPEKKDMQRFSISKLLREAAQGNVTGFEKEMNDEAGKELRECGRTLEGVGIPSFLMSEVRYDYTSAGDATHGGAFKATTSQSYVESLINNLVAAKAGVTYINGLKGNVQFVVGGGATASWAAEEVSVSTTQPTYSSVTMSPKRCQIINAFTYDLLNQSALAVDRIIMNEMTRKHAEALDAAIFAGSGSSGQPQGIIGATGVNAIAMNSTTSGLPLSWAKIVDCEMEVGNDNGLQGRLGYVTNAKVACKGKTIAQIDGYPQYLTQDGKMNGYPLFVTNAIPSNLTVGSSTSSCSDLLFGDFSQVVVGGWGGLQFIIDPYSLKSKGAVEVAAIAYHDVAIKHPECLCVLGGITTA